jgi:hypothetical protein
LPSLPQWSTAFCSPSTAIAAIAAIKFEPWIRLSVQLCLDTVTHWGAMCSNVPSYFIILLCLGECCRAGTQWVKLQCTQCYCFIVSIIPDDFSHQSWCFANHKFTFGQFYFRNIHQKEVMANFLTCI